MITKHSMKRVNVEILKNEYIHKQSYKAPRKQWKMSKTEVGVCEIMEQDLCVFMVTYLHYYFNTYYLNFHLFFLYLYFKNTVPKF